MAQRALGTILLTTALTAPSAMTQNRIFDLEPGLVPNVGRVELHRVGDLDGDGSDDFSVGGLTSGIALTVVSGRTGIPIREVPLDIERPLMFVDLDGNGIMEFISSTSFYGGGDVFVREDGPQGRLMYRLTQPKGSALFGVLVTVVGDLDRDGAHDLAVSSTFDAVRIEGMLISGIGRVYLYSGADGASLGRLEVRTIAQHLGTAVAGLSDVSGDGVPDVAVGALGRAFVFSGIDGALLRELGAPSMSSLFGNAVAGIGDVDGDGVEDVIVGAPQPFSVRAGYAVVFSGRTGVQLYRLDAGVGDFFGTAVAGIDDLDGDGVGDLLVGAPQRTWGSHSGPGYVRAFSGASGAELFTVTGGVDGEGLGSALATVGDVNGDGAPDFVASRGDLSLEPLSVPVARVLSSTPLVLTAGPHVVSAPQGGVQAMSIDATAAHAGDPYVVLGSLSGTAPGINVLGTSIPLNPDGWLMFTLQNPGSALLPGSVGVLDAQGRAQAAFALPPLAGLHGLTFDHAALVLDAGAIALVSRPVPLTLTN